MYDVLNLCRMDVCLQGWLPGKGYGLLRRMMIITIILMVCLAVSLAAPYSSLQVGPL